MTILRAAATADDTLDQTSDTLVNGMTLTPASDDYLLFFTTQIGIVDGNTEILTLSVYVGGVQIDHTERELKEDTSIDNNDITIAVSCKVSPNGSQAVEIRYRTTAAGTPYIARNREMTLFPIPTAGTDFEQSATSDQTTSSAFATLDSMTVTPVADDYLLVFTASGDGTTGEEMGYRVLVGGTPIAHTLRQSLQESSSDNDEVGILIACKVSPNGSQVVEIEWEEVLGPTAEVRCHERTMNLIPIDAGDIFEASSTVDDADSTTTDKQVDNLLISDPGAADYLCIFSAFDFYGTVSGQLGETIYSMREGGTQVTDSTRQNEHESSLDDTNLIAMAGGRVTVTAGNDIQLYWQNVTSTTTRTIKNRTFIAIREAAAGPSLITATAALAFSGAADLEGDGKLDASAALIFAGATVDLKGKGKLDAAAALAFTATADLVSFNLNATAALIFSATTALLRGAGLLAATASMSFSVAANLVNATPSATQLDVYPLNRVEWTTKPPEGTQIDLTHPMAQGLFFFCALDRVGNQVDLVHNREGIEVDTFGGSITYQVQTPDGLVVSIELPDSSTDEVGWNFGNTGGGGYYEPTELTIIWKARIADEVETGGSRVISKRTAAGGADDYALYPHPSDGTSIQFRINDTNDTIVRSSGTYFGVLVEAALAVNADGQDNYVWEPENGTRQVLLAQTGALVDQSVGNLAIGHRDQEDRTFDGEIYYVALFSDRKSEDFIDTFRANPWQIFEKRRSEPLLIDSLRRQTDVYPLRKVPFPSLVVSRKFDHTGDGTTSRGLHYDNMPGLDVEGELVSWACWFNLFEAADADQRFIMVDQQAADVGDAGLRVIFQSTGAIQFNIDTDAVAPFVEFADLGDTPDVWVHVAGRWGGIIGTDVPELYVNGVLSSTTSSSGSGSIVVAPGSHAIGGREQSVSRGVGGRLAGLGRWKNRFLSVQEIQALADGLHPLELPDKLVICPDFDTGENLAPAYTQNPTPNRFDWVKDTFDTAPFLRSPTKRRVLLMDSEGVAAVGAIDATAALIFSQAADLEAIGKLDATAPLVFSATADLKAIGKLDATAALVFSQAADLKARGKLDATALLVFSAAADLKGRGKLDATAALIFSATADLKATGKLDATAALVFGGTAALQEPLVATAVLVFSATANLEAIGKLDATAAMVFAATADLKGRGKLDAAAALVFSATADLQDATPVGAISATAVLIFSATADLKGDGKLDATASLLFAGTADLKAQGKLDATAALVFAGTADLKALGKLDATALLVFGAAADLKGLGKLDATAALIFSAAADLQARGKLDATALLVFTTTADLKAVGKLDAAALLVFAGTADLKGDGKLDATAALVFSATADLVDVTPTGDISATASLVFSAAADLKGDGKLDATATLAFTATKAALQEPLIATAALIFGAAADLQGQGKLDGTAVMVFSQAANLLGVGKLDATAALIFSQAADLKGRGKLDATAVMVFSQAADLKGRGKLDATAAMIFSQAADLEGRGKLDATAAMVFAATADLGIPGDILATALMVFSATADLVLDAQMSATAALIFSATANLLDGAPADLIEIEIKASIALIKLTGEVRDIVVTADTCDTTITGFV